MAISHYAGQELSGLIHHFDCGIQYASYAYMARLKNRGIRISMTENGNPKENAIAERMNNTIKDELLKDMRFTCIPEVRTAVKSAVDFYNNERPHWSLDGIPPYQTARSRGELKKRWTSYRENAIKSRINVSLTG